MLLSLLDFIIPPRKTERFVRKLSLESLWPLMGEDGLPYHDPRVTALIWEIKYYGNSRAVQLAGALLAQMILAAAAEELGMPLLIPVPPHASRRRERGFSHTELLCESALRHVGGAVEYRPDALSRIRATPTQQGLPRGVRLKNVEDSMRAHHAVRERGCIVVDDVSTTGATLKEARRALKAMGAGSVTEVVLARS